MLRKGGIAEGPAGFRPDHAEFWLLPTYFHATPEALKPDDRRFFESAAPLPPADRVRISLFARVAEVFHLDREELLERVADMHVYGQATLHERFHYRRPGLWLLAVQIFRSQSAFELPLWPELAGCHSWADLPQPLSTDGLTAVVEPATFAKRLSHLRQTLTATAQSPADAHPAGFQKAGPQSPLDMAAMFERFEGDQELVERLISIYRQDRFPWMSRALGALVQQDTQALVFAAHRLHGMLSHFDVSPAAQTAGRLERLARQADFPAAQAAYGQLEADLAALDAALDAWQGR